MGLGVRWILSFCLLIVPVAITLGVLFPLQNHFNSQGGSGSFLGGDDGFVSGPGPNNNGLTYETTCAKSIGFGANRRWKGTEYILNPNQWGLRTDDPSGMCMSAIWHNNGTYPNKDSGKDNAAPQFQVTWQYEQIDGTADDPTPNNVHAFPNIKVEDKFPLRFNAISNLTVDFEWQYIIGSDNTTAAATESELNAGNVNTNVAIDMFCDSNTANAGSSEDAAFEIMVWFANFGTSTQVIGQARGVQRTIALRDQTTGQDVAFDLYEDRHPNPAIEQYVMTWKARTMTQKFHGDIYPLVDYLVTSGAANRPVAQDYLGEFGMGSEAYYSPTNVTFYVPDFAVDVTSV